MRVFARVRNMAPTLESEVQRLSEKPTIGEHTITNRASDTAGNMQPAMDDPRIAKKRTYWESNGQISPPEAP
jgi:hypothetical protein